MTTKYDLNMSASNGGLVVLVCVCVCRMMALTTATVPFGVAENTPTVEKSKTKNSTSHHNG